MVFLMFVVFEFVIAGSVMAKYDRILSVSNGRNYCFCCFIELYCNKIFILFVLGVE